MSKLLKSPSFLFLILFELHQDIMMTYMSDISIDIHTYTEEVDTWRLSAQLSLISAAVFRPGPLLCSFLLSYILEYHCSGLLLQCERVCILICLPSPSPLSLLCHPLNSPNWKTPLILDCLLTGCCQLIPCWCNILWWLSVKPVNFNYCILLSGPIWKP